MTDNVVPITRRADALTDGTGLEINQRTIPGRTTITVLTFCARRSDGGIDTAESGLHVETSGTTLLTADQARQPADQLHAAADELDRRLR